MILLIIIYLLAIRIWRYSKITSFRTDSYKSCYLNLLNSVIYTKQPLPLKNKNIKYKYQRRKKTIASLSVCVCAQFFFSLTLLKSLSKLQYSHVIIHAIRFPFCGTITYGYKRKESQQQLPCKRWQGDKRKMWKRKQIISSTSALSNSTCIAILRTTKTICKTNHKAHPVREFIMWQH